jgi:hypothetical protein
MAITWPAKNNYATGDVLTATNMNGIGDDLNALFDNSFYAGKNKIINGDFGIWQRGTSFSTSGTWLFNADRFQGYMSSGTSTLTQQTFTAGTAPVSGYEGTYYLRATAPASGGTFHFRQLVEDVRTFAGQTVTLSFWAKASTNTTLNTYLSQNFGSGGSATVYTSTQGNSVTTSWQRFTYTASVASISGKTIGTNSYLEVYFTTNANFTSSATLDIWGVQLEAGSTATPFQTATGTKQGELAACQRYYFRTGSQYNNNPNYSLLGMGIASTTGAVPVAINFPVPMRVQPTSIETSAMNTFYWEGAAIGNTPTSVTIGGSCTNNLGQVVVNKASSFTATMPYFLFAYNTTGCYIGFNAEL